MIRYLTAEDAEIFLKIRKSGLRLNPESFGASEEEAMDFDQVKQNLGKPNKENFVLGYFDGDVLCGIIGFVRNQQKKKCHKGFIWGFFVLPEYRNKKIGKSLFEECIRRIKEIPGVEKVNLSVTDRSPKALALYENFGFTQYGRESNAYIYEEGSYSDEILLSLEL